MKDTLILICVIAVVITVLYILLKGNLTFLSDIKSQVSSDRGLPDFRFYDLNGTTFTNRNLQGNGSIVLVHFNSECEYCNNEINDAMKQYEKLNVHDVLFVSNESRFIINEFIIKKNLLKYPRLKFLVDPNNTFFNSFKINTIPATLIFNQQKKLIKKIEGEVKFTSILTYIQ